MATSEPLVPKDLPKGSRQQVRAGMQRAGIPLAPRVGDSSGRNPILSPQTPRGNPPTSGVGFDLAAHTPDEFPFLAEQQSPNPVDPTTRGSVATALAGSAQSEFARAVMDRIAQRGGS